MSKKKELDFHSKLQTKIGILGGGQLGQMLCEAGSEWHLPISIMDEDESLSAGKIAPQFICGDITNFQDVIEFGKDKDVVTIEIENVNIEALEILEKKGVKVFPQPRALNLIKDKGKQKLFYQEHNIPTAPFQLFEGTEQILEALDTGELQFPFVQKARTEGYDGRGVVVLKSVSDIKKLLDTASVVEAMADIDKELAVIASKNGAGEVQLFPTVEMAFHPTANLVEYLFCPANIESNTDEKAKKLAVDCINQFDVCGNLAVEMFLLNSGEIWVNEVAPRPHNSGHHTIESCTTSQFQQHLRAILNFPLGSTRMTSPAVMINVLGEDGYNGRPHYIGFEEAVGIEGVHFHIYGKEETRPFRKMGHITVIHPDLNTAIQNARKVKRLVKVISQTS